MPVSNSIINKLLKHSDTKNEELCLRYNIISVLIKGREMVSGIANNGINTFKGSHLMTSEHAEMNAIKQWYARNSDIRSKKKYDFKLPKGISIVVIRVKKKCLGLARPCMRCLKVLNKLGIKTVYYSDMEGNIVKENTKHMLSILLSSATFYRFKILGITIDKVSAAMDYIDKMSKSGSKGLKMLIEHGLPYGLEYTHKCNVYTISHKDTDRCVKLLLN